MSRRVTLSLVAVLLAGSVGALPAAAAPAGPLAAPSAPVAPPGPTVFVGEVTSAQLARFGALGLDHEDVVTARGTDGVIAVEAVMSRPEAARLRSQGVLLREKTVDGEPVSQRMAARAAAGYEVFRPWSGRGGLREELVATARAHPDLTKLVRIGRSTQGKEILALKLTKNAAKVADGSRPAVLYSSTQHAREWITPEMNRRLLAHLLDGYASDPSITRLVDTTELWFVPVANPDGYDFTFTPGNRLWRKTLRDNNGDGQITTGDGVDPNRNWRYRWGYDNEGSSPSPASETYRGPAPGSEPETRALDGLMRRVGFEQHINYHSAAELLLYGVGWQVATPTPDDVLYETMAGDDADPAVPGYDPDISAELYTTNGETTEHAHNVYGTLAFTPEMSTCQTASAVDPDDAFDPADCESVFSFPDSEALVQAEFEKNVPFALAVARSAKDPSNPVSAVGRTAPDFVVDSFSVSYGDPQTVAVVARRDLSGLTVRWSVDGGPVRSAPVAEWRGGERYGDEADRYYAEFRGQVRGARPGDTVRVWFTGRRATASGSVARTSEAFTYRLVEDSNAGVLVLANEDWKGVNPTYPAGTRAPKYARTYTNALADAGVRSTVYDVDRHGPPHHLGVLGHFRGVVWYLGDNRLTQDPEDELTDVLDLGGFPDASVAERQQALTIAVRDYLNEGGKLVHTGETTAYYGTLGGTLGGIYYGLDGDPTADCVVTADPFSDCLIVADDFSQYYLGAFARAAVESPSAVSGSGPLAGAEGAFGGFAAAANPLDEPGTFTVTSDVLPASQFPQFTSRSSAAYRGIAGGAFDPVEGSWYAGAVHVDDSYARLVRTVDLTGVSAAAAPALQARLSVDTEEGYDHVVVEAHTVGADDWTTLPDDNGGTTTAVPTECEVGFLLEEHPFLLRYLTPGDPCTATGTTGAWNSFTGSSGGWQDASFDLSAFAGRQVEVSVTYVTDPGSGGVGAFVDDTRVVAGGATLSAEGFETGLGAWAPAAPPVGSPPGGTAFVRSQGLLSAGVSTEDTVLLGFGVEQLRTRAERADVLGTAVRSLLP